MRRGLYIIRIVADRPTVQWMAELESPMSYQPAENLTNRTFVGLIIAQFLAGFNDQAIHAAAMFYAMHTRILSQEGAITMMPILFYAPWAIFCTLAGFYADKYSK